MKAIDAGKNVLCEKPLAPTARQAAELFEAAKKKGVVLMEAFAYLHTPYIDELKKAVDGKIKTKTVKVLQNCRLEVEQMGRCIRNGEKPHVSEEFSLMNARAIEKVLEAIGYNSL